MWNMLWPLLLIVGSNTFYHICAKSMPEEAHTFGALTVTYLIGSALSAAVFITSVRPANVLTELHKLNWAPLCSVSPLWGWRQETCSSTAQAGRSASAPWCATSALPWCC